MVLHELLKPSTAATITIAMEAFIFRQLLGIVMCSIAEGVTGAPKPTAQPMCIRRYLGTHSSTEMQYPTPNPSMMLHKEQHAEGQAKSHMHPSQQGHSRKPADS